MQKKTGAQKEQQMTIKCIENVMIHEKLESEKQKLRTIIEKYGQSFAKTQLYALNTPQRKLYALYVDGFMAFKQSYCQLIRLEKYRVVMESNFDIIDFLIRIQSNLSIKCQNPTSDNLIARYTVDLIKLKNQKKSWGEQFFIDWSLKSKDKLRDSENKRAANQKSAMQQQKEQEIDLLAQNPHIRFIPRDKQPQKKITLSDKPKKTPQTKPQAMTYTGKNRRQFMEKYLESRQDIKVNKNKQQEVAEFLLSKLDEFMKQALGRIIDISALKDKKNSEIKDEISYFRPQNERVYTQTPFLMAPKSKIFTLQYKHKLQIYKALRSKQLMKQDDLRVALESNTSQIQKNNDKNLENYMLKPRPQQAKPIRNVKEDREQVKRTNNINIRVEHIIFYLENHRYLRNSLLLFNACQE